MMDGNGKCPNCKHEDRLDVFANLYLRDEHRKPRIENWTGKRCSHPTVYCDKEGQHYRARFTDMRGNRKHLVLCRYHALNFMMAHGIDDRSDPL